MDEDGEENVFFFLLCDFVCADPDGYFALWCTTSLLVIHEYCRCQMGGMIHCFRVNNDTLNIIWCLN